MEIRFHSSVEGLIQGAQVWIDGAIAVDSLSSSDLDLFLQEGPHTIAVRKPCVTVEPSESLRVQIVAGTPAQIDFRLDPASASLTVTSDPDSLPVRLNGVLSALRTPHTFTCVAPGTYEVSIPSWALERIGVPSATDSARTVVVGQDGNSQVAFDFTQKRGVLLEIFTATYCPNCPPADAAAEELDHDPQFEPDWFSSVQLHVYWGGTDPLYFDEIEDRVSFYRLDASAPHAWFNGMDKVSGSNYPNIRETYRSKILKTYGQRSKVNLYWSDVRVAGDGIVGDLRCTAMDDLRGFSALSLITFFAKDSIVAQNPFNVEQFSGVVRDYLPPVDLTGGGINRPGQFIDVPVHFDLAADARWPSHSLRVVAIVQDMATREILQCRVVRMSL